MKNSLKGTLTITRPQGGCRDDNYISLEIQDELSRVTFVEVEISAEEMMLALTALGYRPCEFRLTHADKVGMKCEHTTATVCVPDGSIESRMKRAEAAIADHPLSKEGWIGYATDACNSHRIVWHDENGTTYRVGFHRYVTAI